MANSDTLLRALIAGNTGGGLSGLRESLLVTNPYIVAASSVPGQIPYGPDANFWEALAASAVPGAVRGITTGIGSAQVNRELGESADALIKGLSLPTPEARSEYFSQQDPLVKSLAGELQFQQQLKSITKGPERGQFRTDIPVGDNQVRAGFVYPESGRVTFSGDPVARFKPSMGTGGAGTQTLNPAIAAQIASDTGVDFGRPITAGEANTLLRNEGLKFQKGEGERRQFKAASQLAGAYRGGTLDLIGLPTDTDTKEQGKLAAMLTNINNINKEIINLLDTQGIQWFTTASKERDQLFARSKEAYRAARQAGAQFTLLEMTNAEADVPDIGSFTDNLVARLRGYGDVQSAKQIAQNTIELNKREFANRLPAYKAYVVGHKYDPYITKTFGIPTNQEGVAVQNDYIKNVLKQSFPEQYEVFFGQGLSGFEQPAQPSAQAGGFGPTPQAQAANPDRQALIQEAIRKRRDELLQQGQ